MKVVLATDKFKTGDLKFTHVLKDIQTLNQIAMTTREYDVTAVSFHAYAHIAEHYLLLPHGSSMGDRYGPIVVARADGPSSLKNITVAVPGTLTTAFLALRIYDPSVKYVVMPFDVIQDKVRDGEIEAGLLIHEGQLFYDSKGLHKVLDLGEWWQTETGLPLPLGGNIIKRNLGEKMMERVSRDIRKSIQYALDHRDEALSFAMQFSRGLDTNRADRFVGMYVNELTLDYGAEGKKAVRRLLSEAHKKKIIPSAVKLEFV